MLRPSRNDPEVTSAWTDTGTRQARQLKHRVVGEVRYPPITPQLAELLRRHLDVYGTGAGGLAVRRSPRRSDQGEHLRPRLARL